MRGNEDLGEGGIGEGKFIWTCHAKNKWLVSCCIRILPECRINL